MQFHVEKIRQRDVPQQEPGKSVGELTNKIEHIPFHAKRRALIVGVTSSFPHIDSSVLLVRRSVALLTAKSSFPGPATNEGSSEDLL